MNILIQFRPLKIRARCEFGLQKQKSKSERSETSIARAQLDDLARRVGLAGRKQPKLGLQAAVGVYAAENAKLLRVIAMRRPRRGQ